MNLWQEKSIRPMLLKEVKKPFNKDSFIFELKFDGIRTIIYANPKEVIITNRYGKKITHLYPELQQIKKLVTKNTILDGEIISLEEGKPSFLKLQKRIHIKDNQKIAYQSKKNPVIFMCFDILFEDKSLIDKPLIERKKLLSKIKDNDVFVKVKYVEENGIEYFKEVKKQHLEGIVAKEKNSIYEINKRTAAWLKIKNLKTDTFIIGGFIEKEENAVVSLLLGEKKKNKLFYVGKVSVAKKNKIYKQIKKQKRKKTSPFENVVEDAYFVNPMYHCQVEYLERTKDGHLRHPIYRNN